MPRKVFRVRGAVVGVDSTALDNAIRRLERDGVEAAAEVVEQAVREQYAIAFREWGVQTGQGRESLQVVAVREGTGFAVRIFSRYRPIRYQSFDGRPPTFWQVLVRRPLQKVKKKLAKLSAGAMADAVLGGGGRPKGSGRGGSRG